MRIAVMTDVHANLPALQAALHDIRANGCDAIFCTGDAIAIGPYPAETLDVLLSEPKVQCVMGNHEAYYVRGLPEPRPEWLSDGEVLHQQWTHAQLGGERRHQVATWPYTMVREFEGVTARFVHYGLDASGRDFVPIEKNPGVQQLDMVFGQRREPIVFYGHDHTMLDLCGQARYVNPGALGCYSEAVARYCLVDFHSSSCEIRHQSVAYDDAPLFKTFEDRQVPERDFIYKAFLGARFGTR